MDKISHIFSILQQPGCTSGEPNCSIFSYLDIAQFTLDFSKTSMVYRGSWLYRTVLSPFYDKLVKVFPRSVHPNHMTILGGICALLSVYSLYIDMRWAAAFLFTAYHMLDNMDGKHARATGQSSDIGAILDHFVDGTSGILAGAMGMQYGLVITQDRITYGVFCFTTLFYIVHAIHAFSGFFELGGEYLSIDEANLFLTFVFILHALDMHDFPFLTTVLFHQIFLVSIIAAALFWLISHGPKCSLSKIKSRFFILVPGALYFGGMALGGLNYCLSIHFWGPTYVIAFFALPYAIVLYESKDLH